MRPLSAWKEDGGGGHGRRGRRRRRRRQMSYQEDEYGPLQEPSTTIPTDPMYTNDYETRM